MFNSELGVIDPVSSVPTVLLTRAQTVVVRMHKWVSLAERIISSPCLCVFNILCGEDGQQGRPQKTFKI